MTFMFGKIINKLEIKLMPKLRNLSEIRLFHKKSWAQ
jgi:hypothetical protein